MAGPVGALQERPILADAVKAAISRDGAAAAEREFMTILETRALDYDYDPRRMMALLQAFMEAGEMESAQVGEEAAARARMLAALGDTEFRWAGDDFADPIRATFATGQAGTATGLTVDLEGSRNR